jgi:erythritol transport system substrate-binding protein
MQSMLQAHPNIVGVISGNDEMALGAIAALKTSSKLSSVKSAASTVLLMPYRRSKRAICNTPCSSRWRSSKKAVDEADSFLKSGKTGAASESSSSIAS